jgi:hypothetical protein
MVLSYEELTDPERAVWEAVESGKLVDLRLGDPDRDDPAKGATWDSDRQVRAQLLYELLRGVSKPKDTPPRALKLAGAWITGALDLEAVTLLCPLLLRGCYVDHPITLEEASAPALRLPRCHVASLNADQLETRGSVELNDGFTATGEVRLVGAHIKGQLDCSGAILANPDGLALSADSLTVDQSMYCRNGFTVTGEVRLVGARIGGNLEFDGASLANPDGLALSADKLTVDQSMYCRNGFTVTGEVNLIAARIGGTLTFNGASLNNRGRLALDLEGARARAVRLLLQTQPDGRVDLTNAHIGDLYDSQATWPEALLLSGFVYDALHADPKVTYEARLNWLGRDPGGYQPQLYEQLAAYYRRAGQDDDARKVAIAKQRRRRQTLNLAGKVWTSLLRWTVGYGYQSWKAGVWLLGLVGLGWWIFDRLHPAQLVPAKPPGQRPSFHAGLYALDLLLPFADLGYQGAWIASGWARGFYLAWNLAGWVLITAVVAALSGLIKRD